MSRAPIAMTREEAARRRVYSALADIEAAQNHLARAAAAMSSLLGVRASSSEVMRLHVQVKRSWYRLEERWRKSTGSARSTPIVLDHEPNQYESEWGALPSEKPSGDAPPADVAVPRGDS